MESKIQKRIIEYLKSKGAYVIKVILSNENGTADIISCINGLFVGFEVKDLNKKARPLQIHKLNNITRSNGLAFEVDNLEDVKLIFSRISEYKAPQIEGLPNRFLTREDIYHRAKQIDGF